MNMNDAFIGSLIFNKDSGGGDSPLEFTKTSILDKTQMTNIVLTEDYTNYPFLLFSHSCDGVLTEALVPTVMLTEAFDHSLMIAFTRASTNYYIRYSKVSNTRFDRYNTSWTEVVDVYGVTVNKPFTTDIIYSRGNGGETEVTISHDNILDNDIIFFSGCWNADADFANNFIWNNGNTNNVITRYDGTLIRRGNYPKPIIVTNTSISSAIYYMVLGIKFA